MLGHRGRDQVGVVGRAHGLQQPLAAQQFERHRVAVHQIDFVAPRPGFDDGALQDLLGGRAPGADFHAVLLFERRVERRHVLRWKRRIQADKALAARAFEQALMAVRALVRGEARQRAPDFLRREERRGSKTRGRDEGDQSQPPGRRDLRFHGVGVPRPTRVSNSLRSAVSMAYRSAAPADGEAKTLRP